MRVPSVLTRSIHRSAPAQILIFKSVFLCALCLPLLAPAQSVLTIDTQKCLWHPGDDPAWAAPAIDESTWRPYSEWKPDSRQWHLWIRCHADFGPLYKLDDPQIQVTFFSAYQLFLDGVLIGDAGNLRNGDFSLHAIRSYSIPQESTSSGRASIALRVTDRTTLSFTTTNTVNSRGSLSEPLSLVAGKAQILEALRDHVRIERSLPYAIAAVCYSAVGVAALMFFGVYFFDRRRYEFLLLPLFCVGFTIFRLNALAAAALIDYPISAFIFIFYITGQIFPGTIAPFIFFSIARRRVPIFFWALITIIILINIPGLVDALLGAGQPAWLDPFRTTIVQPIAILSRWAAASAAFFAFYPLSNLPQRLRPLAILCMLWGLADFFWYALQSTSLHVPGIPNLFVRWGFALLNIRSFTIAAVLIGLFALLLREQREVTLERALLAGELHAASEIQRMLAPAALDSAPGLKIDVAFHPMREVGGDFYLCRVLPGRRQRILLGDVSGKGSAAAMTATLILGGADDHDLESPAEILAHLNRILLNSRVSGFATCLCADFAASGEVTLANAGHLAPYLRGEEVSIPSGLPLGLSSRSPDAFQQTTFALEPGDTLTLISDGVVEARNSTGELFGFDRTRAISVRSAEEIASAAQNHGQEDDITVLTITRIETPEPIKAIAATSELATA